MSKQAPSHPKKAAPPAQLSIAGRDEMNLAEFPIGKLGVRDKRETLTYEGWLTDNQGNRYRQKWIVSGSKQYGLPHELGNRILVVFITLAAQRHSKEVFFTDYQMLRMLRLTDGQANYKHFERNLLQLAGLTIYSEQAFWDNEQQKYLTTKRAFHIFEDVWLSSWRDGNDEATNGQGYAVFNDVFWGNIQSGYLKSLDLELYLGTLGSALARQLYRCLDKFMRYRMVFESDLFDLAARIGLQPYPYPSIIKEKLQPAIRELIACGFLERASFRKVGNYTRVRFIRSKSYTPPPAVEPESAQAEPAENFATPRALDRRAAIQQHYQISADHQALWDAVLQGLTGQLPSATFMTFVEPTLLIAIEDETATVGAANPFAQGWLESRMVKRFQDELNYHLRATGHPEVSALRVVPLGKAEEEGE